VTLASDVVKFYAGLIPAFYLDGERDGLLAAARRVRRPAPCSRSGPVSEGGPDESTT